MNDMKKVAAVVAMVLCLSCVGALATISIEWFTYGELRLSDGTTPLPVGSITQLIWSPDSGISSLLWSDPLTPQGGEVLLRQYTNVIAGRVFVPAQDYVEADYGIGDTNGFAGGYAYMRVFDYLGASGTPTNGTWFGEGQLPIPGPIGSQHQSPAPTSTLVDPTGGDSFTLDQQIVPEPATWALLGFGVLVMAARRRFVK
jgi:hypothetical protein